MDNNQNQLVFAGDGDNIGKRHAQAILSDNLDQVKKVSEAITNANDFVREFIESHGGVWISGGGDEFSFTAPSEFVDLLEELRQDYKYMVNATLSIGYGQTISQAGKALLVAKERGKDQIVQYDDSVEQEVKEIEDEKPSDNDEERKKIKAVIDSDNNQQMLSENQEVPNTDSEDDEGVNRNQVLPTRKDSSINEPTLCEPPKNDNNLSYDSGYKNSSPEKREESYRANDVTPPTIKKPNLTSKPKIQEAVTGDIQESTRPMNEIMPDPKDKKALEQKPAPKEYEGQAEGESMAPENIAQPDEQKPSDLKYNNGEQKAPNADIPIENATSDKAMETESEDMDEEKHCPSCTCGNHGDSIDSTLDQHLENAKDFNDSMGGEKDSENILDQHIENANEMNQNMDENGVSRPEDYDQKEGDLGLSEEGESEPNLNEVLKDGLDEHAENIQKEKVVQLVGQALDGFKSQKAILDKAKEQAPELYDSCISMLRAMIELCTLAGLKNSGDAEQEVNEIEGQPQNPEEAPNSEKMPEEISNKPKKECPNCGHGQPSKEESPFPKK